MTLVWRIYYGSQGACPFRPAYILRNKCANPVTDSCDYLHAKAIKTPESLSYKGSGGHSKYCVCAYLKFCYQMSQIFRCSKIAILIHFCITLLDAFLTSPESVAAQQLPIFRHLSQLRYTIVSLIHIWITHYRQDVNCFSIVSPLWDRICWVSWRWSAGWPWERERWLW